MHVQALFIAAILTLVYPVSSNAQPSWGHHGTFLTPWEQIHQKLNSYPLIIDRKNWERMPDLFTQDAFANYSGLEAKGVKAITASLKAAVSDVDSQHLLGTTHIDVSPDGETGDATVYVQATLWAKPQETPGQYVNLYGYYEDHLVKTSGGWRIQNRLFALIGPGVTGNLTLIGM